ncbi:MAG: AraC family transcriptional regulator [Lachnospiraceae bacterium]|nr:AraC family transcriptional regulator [Lachnospiraceae bacterium]
MYKLPTGVFEEFMEHPLVRRLYLTDVGFYPKAKHHYMERNVGIGENIFFYCVDGEGTICIDGKRYKLHAKEAFCIPHDQKHCYYADKEKPWSILWVHFSGEDTSLYSLDTYKVVSFHSRHATNRMLYLFDLLFQVLEEPYSLGNFAYMTQVLALILSDTYLKERKEEASGNVHVSNIIRYMNSHLEENCTLDDLSEKFKLSKSYLNVIFRKYTKKSPIDLFVSLKMTEACKLLKTTDMYIYEVANAVGYKDPYYFSKIFRKVVGTSPTEYKGGNYIHIEM